MMKFLQSCLKSLYEVELTEEEEVQALIRQVLIYQHLLIIVDTASQ